MEYKSPTTDKSPTKSKFKGEGRILIFALLADDDKRTREMFKMTNLLEEVIKKGNLNRATRRVDCYQALNQCDVRGENVLYVTGHSRYLDSNDTIRAISDRTLGGFALDAVAELFFNAICAGIQDIELWCCETACKKGTEELKATDATTAKQTLNLDALYQLKTAVENKAATSVSTLDYICYKLTQLYSKQEKTKQSVLKDRSPFRITALNGVGSFEPGDEYISTFDQTATLPDINKIEDAIRNQKRMEAKGRTDEYAEKNIRYAEKRIQKAQKMKVAKCCDFITIELNFQTLESEVKGRKSAQPQKETSEKPDKRE